ncbi:ArdC-like ssDNA-binding domain-containing protein, partial [Acinetobacter sp. DSM 11652]
MKQEYAESVAARIIEQLEQGTAPWLKPWKP